MSRPILFCALLALLSGQRTLASQGAQFPRRVMSISLCTDQLLLDLLPPSRITSVTYLSREPSESYLSAEAWKVPVNYGMAEEIVQERPDLVLAGAYTTPPARQLLKAVGIRMMVLPPANSFEDIRNQTLQVGHALGADVQAERLVRQMEATLAQLAATPLPHPLSILGLDGSGVAYGRGTLFDAIISAAGAVNLDTYAGYGRASYDAELLLWARPDLLAFGDATIASPSLENSDVTQPLLRRVSAGRQIIYPELLYSCGLPQSADAAVQIRRVMLPASHPTLTR